MVTSVSIAGVVMDSAQAPLPGTVIQVVSGGLLHSTLTNAEGLYSFSDLTVPVGPVTVRASKQGFVSVTETRPTTPEGLLQVDFTLMPTGGVLPFNLAGEHTLTLTADAACEMLPPVTRARTYLASARSTFLPTYFDVALSGASFFPRHEMMFATATTPGLLSVPSPDDGFSVYEVLSDGSHVSIYGASTIAQWSNDVSAPFIGTIGYCSAGGKSADGTFPVCNGQYVQCSSTSHRIRLTRR